MLQSLYMKFVHAGVEDKKYRKLKVILAVEDSNITKWINEQIDKKLGGK